MVGHKGIPRTRKSFPREFHYPLYWWDQHTQYKFCPRAIWLNVWTSRAKNTFIDLGIRIYLCAFQTDISVHLEALMLAWGWLGGNTGLTTDRNRLLEVIRAAALCLESWRPQDVELRFLRTGCWMQEAHSSGSARSILSAKEIFTEKRGEEARRLEQRE